MQLTLLGHAGVMLEHDNHRVITDPWFGNSFHYDTFHPESRIYVPPDSILQNTDAIYISHRHQDHFSSESLARFHKDTRIIIPKFEARELFNRVQKIGFRNVSELSPWTEKFQVGPFELACQAPELFNGSFDSSLLVHCAGRFYYFMNDCVLSDASLNRLASLQPIIHGGFLANSAISPYPSCYDISLSLDPAVQKMSRIESLEKVALYYKKYFEDFCEKFNLQWSVPYAGDLRFLHEESFHQNEIFEICNKTQFTPTKTQVLSLKNGETLNGLGKIIRKESLEPFLPLDQRIIRPKKQTVLLSPNDISTLRFQFLNWLTRNSQAWEKPMTVEIISDGFKNDFKFCFSFNKDEVQETQSAPDMTIKYYSSVLEMLLQNQISLPEIPFTFRFDVKIHKGIKGQMGVHLWN